MNWIRRNVQPRLRAIALARTVLPVPGTSSMSRCPRHSSATSARRTSWCLPTITRSTLARTLSPVSWIFVMGLRLPSRGICVAWGGAAGFDGCGRRRCAVPSGVMPNSTSRRKKRFRGPSLGCGRRSTPLPQAQSGARRTRTVLYGGDDRAAPRWAAPLTYIDVGNARIVHSKFRATSAAPLPETLEALPGG